MHTKIHLKAERNEAGCEATEASHRHPAYSATGPQETFPLQTGDVDTSCLMAYRPKKLTKSQFTTEQISNKLKESEPRGSLPRVARKHSVVKNTRS